ncbi:MAG: hypothetical protein H6835_17910 [Planctomycetes bacterium]|nr:hypothetical protein [Planctomycetota bacterium]
MKLHGLLLLSSLSFVACVGQTYRADAGVMMLRARGDVALQNAAQAPVPPSNSVYGQLGQGSSQASPYLALRTDYERHRIKLHGFGFDNSGSGALTQNFGDLTAGTQVQSNAQFWAAAANYGYELLREDLPWLGYDAYVRLAAGVELGFYSLDVSAQSGALRESVQTSVLVPLPFVEAEAVWGPVTVGANLGVMSADLGDGNGKYWDFETNARWQITEEFDVMGGYRYLLLNVNGRASDRDFDADIDLQGIFLTAGITF